MNVRRSFLFVSPFPASPASFGAQRRIEGLMRMLAERNEVSFVGLLGPEFDTETVRRAMGEYCSDVVLVPWKQAAGLSKRTAQLRSLFSLASYERRYMNSPALQEALDRLLKSRRFDVVSVETPFLAFSRFDRAPAGENPPRVIIDAHNVEFDLARQYYEKSNGFARKLHNGVNWRKLRREEILAWRRVDGVAFTSPDDEARARALVPTLNATVVPNGVDTDAFRPHPSGLRPDGRTVVFFGTMNYFPNVDAVRWLLDEIWPRIEKRHPHARLKIIGSHPLPDVLAKQGPRIEVTGLVDDLQRHLAEAATIVVPLRIGGGTRLKILESLAMGKAIVSTRLGAEGIAVVPEKHLLLADDAEAIAEGVVRVLESPELAERLGRSGRELAERCYSWRAIGQKLEAFSLALIEAAEPRATDLALA